MKLKFTAHALADAIITACTPSENTDVAAPGPGSGSFGSMPAGMAVTYDVAKDHFNFSTAGVDIYVRIDEARFARKPDL